MHQADILSQKRSKLLARGLPIVFVFRFHDDPWPDSNAIRKKQWRHVRFHGHEINVGLRTGNRNRNTLIDETPVPRLKPELSDFAARVRSTQFEFPLISTKRRSRIPAFATPATHRLDHLVRRLIVRHKRHFEDDVALSQRTRSAHVQHRVICGRGRWFVTAILSVRVSNLLYPFHFPLSSHSTGSYVATIIP